MEQIRHNINVRSLLHCVMPPVQSFYITDNQRVILGQTNVQILNTQSAEGRKILINYDDLKEVQLFNSRIMINKQNFVLNTKAAAILYNGLLYRCQVYKQWSSLLCIDQFIKFLLNPSKNSLQSFQHVQTMFQSMPWNYIKLLDTLRAGNQFPWYQTTGDFTNVTFQLTESFDIPSQRVSSLLNQQQQTCNTSVDILERGAEQIENHQQSMGTSQNVSEKSNEENNTQNTPVFNEQSQDAQNVSQNTVETTSAIQSAIQWINWQRRYLKNKFLSQEEVMVKTVLDSHIAGNYQATLLQAARNLNKSIKMKVTLEELGTITKEVCNQLTERLDQDDIIRQAMQVAQATGNVGLRSLQVSRGLQVSKTTILAQAGLIDALDLRALAAYTVEVLLFQLVSRKMLFQTIYETYELEDLKIYNYCNIMKNMNIYNVLEIDEKYRDPENFEYASAVLSKIDTLGYCVCKDYLQVFLETVMAITQTVQINSNGLCQLACDDLLPLLIYVCIRTGCVHMMSTLRYCEVFINETLENNEYGNALIHFHVALEYIQQLHQKQLYQTK